MSSAISDIITAFGDVLVKFTEPPLSYAVGLMIVSAVAGMIRRIIRRR